MKILLVGHGPRISELLRALCGLGRRDGVHCASDLEGVRELLSAGNRYAVALLFSSEEGSDSREVDRILRQSNSEMVLAYLSFAGERENRWQHATPKLLAVFEKTVLGKRLLNCMLAPPTPVAGLRGAESDSIIFEYHAPCRPGGGGQ